MRSNRHIFVLHVLFITALCVRLDDADSQDAGEEAENANCRVPAGPNFVRGERVEAAFAQWRALPSEAWASMPAKPAFIMLAYRKVAFPKAWETMLNSTTEDKYHFIVHTKNSGVEMPPFFQKRRVTGLIPTRRCSSLRLIVTLMKNVLSLDPQVSHIVLVSGDSLPSKPLAHILDDLEDESRSRFCVDSDLRRAETFFAIRRDLANFFCKHFEESFLTVMPETRCPDEDMLYWAAFQRGEAVVDSCIFFSDWGGTPKFWSKNAERCECPDFRSSFKFRPASCGRPALFGGIQMRGLQQIFNSRAGYWFIRKFPGDQLPGEALVLSDDNALENTAIIAILDQMRRDNQEQVPRPLSLQQTEAAEAGDGDGLVTSKSWDYSLDNAAAKLLLERRDATRIPLLVVPDPLSDLMQEEHRKLSVTPRAARALRS